MPGTERSWWNGRLDPDTWPSWLQAIAVATLLVGALVLLLLGPQKSAQLIH